MRAAALLVAALAGPAALVAPAALAQGQGGNQSGNCAGCHGAQGEGNPQAGFPRLAGQPKEYLRRQLDAYADGSRSNAVMSPIAKGMTPEQREAAAAHYAALAAPRAGAQPTPASARGRTIAGVGDHAISVQGCDNCHGPAGAGLPPAIPYLAGLPEKYLQSALGEWKSGARNSDPSGQMQGIGKRLTDEDIAAVAKYYAAQRPPAPPRAPQVARAARAAPTAPGTATQAPRGTGTEQGSATTGGSQGPGGSGGSGG